TSLLGLAGSAQNGHGEQVARLKTEPRRLGGPQAEPGSHPQVPRRIARPFVRRMTGMRNEVTRPRFSGEPEQASAACRDRAGLPKKQTPWGKPRDMLTWARSLGR